MCYNSYRRILRNKYSKRNALLRLLRKMKKIVCLILSILSVLSLAACGSAALPVAVDNPPPWSATASAADAYEKSVYSVNKTDASGETVAEGSVTYVLEHDHTDAETNFSYSRLSMEMSVTYNDNAGASDAGKTDRITSFVVFQSDALVPQYSEKTVELADRNNAVNNSYVLKNDYAEYKSELTMKGKETSVINFTGQSFVSVYDNEMLYYAVRSFTDVKAGGTNVFNLANFFDMHVKGEYFNYNMTFSCSAEGAEETMYLPQFGGKYLDEQGSISAITVNLSINDSLSGPPIELKYSMTPFKVGENRYTKKALVSFKTFEYDVGHSALKYTTEYKLTDYTTEKPAA